MRGHESLYVMLELRPVPLQDPDIHVSSRTSRSIGLGSRRVSRLRDPKQSPNPPIGVISNSGDIRHLCEEASSLRRFSL